MKLTHTQKVKLARKLAPRVIQKGPRTVSYKGWRDGGLFKTKGWEARKYSIITRLVNKTKK